MKILELWTNPKQYRGDISNKNSEKNLFIFSNNSPNLLNDRRRSREKSLVLDRNTRNHKIACKEVIIKDMWKKANFRSYFSWTLVTIKYLQMILISVKGVDMPYYK